MKIVYSVCPICNNKSLTHQLFAMDHTVSNETFEIVECDNCSLRLTQNVEDQNAIGKYYQSENYISHSDTKKGFINILYHKIRQRTLKSKNQLLQKYTGKLLGNALDIGAGTGAFLDTMKKNNWNVTGIEPDERARKNAFETYGIQLMQDELLFTLAPESYDAITLWHVLEHVHDLNGYLLQLKILLKPKGRIFIAVPNYTSYDARKYHENWAAYDVPRHLYHFSPASIKKLLDVHQLKLIKVQPMWYDSFYVSMLSELYQKGRNNYGGALVTGLLSNLNACLNKEKASSLIYIIAK